TEESGARHGWWSKARPGAGVVPGSLGRAAWPRRRRHVGPAGEASHNDRRAPEMSTNEPSLLVTTEGPIVWLQLNRPRRKNALDRDLVLRLGTALEAAAARPETRVVVLRGSEGSFCSGADLASMKPEALSDG